MSIGVSAYSCCCICSVVLMRVFIMNVEFCQMLFSASVEVIMWFLSFLLLMCHVTLICVC